MEPPKKSTMIPLVPITDPTILAVREGSWYKQPEQRVWRPPSSSFANRTEDWMSLSQIAAGSLDSKRVQMATPRPTMPPDRYKKKPGSWPEKAWNEYQRAYEKLA